MDHLFAFSWVWIPIVAILVGGFNEWLKFRTKQEELRASSSSMQGDIEKLHADMRRQQAELVQRIENLEAIVTSQTWDLLHGPGAESTNRLELPREDEISDSERAARLARRLNS